MSCLLSSLYVMSQQFNDEETKVKKLLGHFRAILDDFPPAVLALKVILSQKTKMLNSSLKAALSCGSKEIQ